MLAIEASHLPAGSEPMEKSKKTRGRGIEKLEVEGTEPFKRPANEFDLCWLIT